MLSDDLLPFGLDSDLLNVLHHDRLYLSPFESELIGDS